MKNDALIHLQVFYEIAMAVGNSLDLNKMLKSSLTAYLKKLSCSTGIIYQTFRRSDNMWRFTPQCAIPRNAVQKKITQNSMPIIPEQLNIHELKPYLSSLPICGKADTGQAFHIMELPGFGLLSLFKTREPIDRTIIRSLIHTNKKLASSAVACLQNEKIEKINHQLSKEILIRKTAEKAKSQFIANMSHELLTPMNGIVGFNKLLCDSGLTEKQHEFSDSLSASADSLLTIIKNLFEFSKIEAENLELENIDFNIHRLALDLIDLLRHKADEKGLKIHFDILDDTPEYLKGDPKRIRQILTHLIDNAIKFTEAGDIRVQIHAKTQSPGNDFQIKFSVSDTGIGIPDEKKDLLFATFTQADESDTRKYGGIGLGLAICKKLAKLLKGRIEVSDNKEGGSVFSFTLLLNHAQPHAGDQKSAAISNDTDVCALVVDDNPVNRKIIEGICEKLGWETQTANDGKQAIAVLESKTFDIILMDCQMPVMDGYEATKIIRNLNSAVLRHDAPIIAVTANISDENREECLRAGMNDFISKPVTLEKIQTISNYALKKG